eukprot:Unigene1311_Nuclearia_a/m.4172 Unigene1311_Nuclearia_a/g.4172  ORF Unigene1311_Nuclearia_a/g.4172 Unigene1311_Nuclearia_a/m.4172 type:complete len:479 (+) Unigene1311_Nuclearia_a:16-1452(+)
MHRSVAAVLVAALLATAAATARPISLRYLPEGADPKTLTTTPWEDGMSVAQLVELPSFWAAMMLCSGVFVAGLPFDVAFDEDCDLACLAVNATVNYREQSVTATLLGGGFPVKSIYRGDGIGCTTVDGLTEEELRAQNIGNQGPLPPLNDRALWPLGNAIATELDPEVDWDAVYASVEADFANPRFNTRAVTIAYKGELVYERYKDGVDANTRLIGWSCTKSVTNSLLSQIVGEGRINVTDRMPVPEWNVQADDPRAAVTVQNMLHMAHGQLWREASGDVRCLFIDGEGNCAGWFANQRQEIPPGSAYEYSTGCSTLLLRTVMQQRGDAQWTNFEWPRQKLFKRLSMNTALIESQANTYQLGGSNAYMAARDWLRLGLAYARDGIWVDGTRVLPEGWVDYTKTPSPTNGGYGAHFGLGNSAGVPYFAMNGFRDQNVWIFQSKDLVITRNAMPPLIGGGWSRGAFLDPIVRAFPDVKTA